LPSLSGSFQKQAQVGGLSEAFLGTAAGWWLTILVSLAHHSGELNVFVPVACQPRPFMV
jgi:hypothetical protein